LQAVDVKKMEGVLGRKGGVLETEKV